jgi:hypothetical protein
MWNDLGITVWKNSLSVVSAELVNCGRMYEYFRSFLATFFHRDSA